MAFVGRAVRAGVKAGIAKKVYDELRKPENQARLKAIGQRVLAEARKPENQAKARRMVQSVRRPRRA